MVAGKSPSMTSTSKHIYVKYHWFKNHVLKEFLIWNIESENKQADIFAKFLQGELFVVISKLLCGW